MTFTNDISKDISGAYIKANKARLKAREEFSGF